MTFQDLQLLPQLLRAVAEMGYAAPSPIQAQAIPPVLAGRDLIGCAQTGTGKTAAFAIPILQTLQSRVDKTHRPIRALVLTPTRELALQIKENFDLYGKYLPIRNTVIFGGVGQGPQVEALQRGVDVLVATPGRLNDLCNQGHIDLTSIETFVLDEADRMLDMGFIHDVRKVIARLPKKRQTLLFSATMPQEIAELSQQILYKPVRVEVTPQSSTVEAIEQRVYKVDKANKKHLLQYILQDQSLDSVLVFTNTKHGADRVVKELGRAGIAAMAIHGNKGQTARVKALESFKSGAVRVLQRAGLRHQLRAAQRPGDLRPPHRPHRPGGPGRPGHQLLQLRRAGLLEGHREAHRQKGAGGGGPPLAHGDLRGHPQGGAPAPPAPGGAPGGSRRQADPEAAPTAAGSQAPGGAQGAAEGHPHPGAGVPPARPSA